jgi:hypothetical protein
MGWAQLAGTARRLRRSAMARNTVAVTSAVTINGVATFVGKTTKCPTAMAR